MRQEYYALLNTVNPPSDGCWHPADTEGALAGGWFAEPYDGNGATNFVAGWALTVGTSIHDQLRVYGEQNWVWIDVGQLTYTDPSKVTENCCEHTHRGDKKPDRHVFLKLLSPTEISVAFGKGACPDSLPESTRSTIDSRNY